MAHQLEAPLRLSGEGLRRACGARDGLAPKLLKLNCWNWAFLATGDPQTPLFQQFRSNSLWFEGALEAKTAILHQVHLPMTRHFEMDRCKMATTAPVEYGGSACGQPRVGLALEFSLNRRDQISRLWGGGV